jgi:hypothetical protein
MTDKRSRLAALSNEGRVSLVKRDLGQLTALARTRLRRMQYRPPLLEGFLAGIGLGLTPFGSPTIENRLRHEAQCYIARLASRDERRLSLDLMAYLRAERL